MKLIQQRYTVQYVNTPKKFNNPSTNDEEGTKYMFSAHLAVITHFRLGHTQTPGTQLIDGDREQRRRLWD